MDCDCDLSYQGIFRGFKGEVACKTKSQCFVPPSSFCATGDIEFDLAAGLFVETGLDSNITACFNVTDGFPNFLGTFLELDNLFCFQFKPKGLKLDECSVKIGEKDCNSCVVCDSDVDFKFDCSNIDLESKNGNVTILGPNITTCIGLSAIPTNSTF